MLMSEHIARIIEALLSEHGGEAELQRNELATRLGCVPSQINYVITSRFSPERGYIVESRRGGGGYIRIKKVELDKIAYVMHFLSAISDSIDIGSAEAFVTNLAGEGLVSAREATMMKASLSDRALASVPAQYRNGVRASVLRAEVLELLNLVNNLK